MGCYGIGISRLMGIIAEIFSDEKGLVWPENIAPYKVYLVQIGNSETVTSCSDKLYDDLRAGGIEVLYDDRDVRPGQKFADSELMGIPYRITVSERLVEDSLYELVSRIDGQKTM
jgi:prolyl-tRNA synthetase